MNYNEIKDTLQKLGRSANKNLGQNFLANQIYADIIVGYLDAKKEDNILEIGAGLGGLSAILTQTEATITLNECDREFLGFLKEEYKDTSCEFLEGDILMQNLSNYNKIVGNLPYYITTPIIKKVLLDTNNLDRFVFMVQKEVGQKLLAKENSKEYGPLHILMNLLGNLSYCKEIKPHNFYPVPHVDSVVMVLDAPQTVDSAFKRFLFKNLIPLFAYNRKTLRNNLKGHVFDKELERIFQQKDISLDKRPQQIEAGIYISVFETLFEVVKK